MALFIGNKTYFPFAEQIRYEGPASDNPLAFKYYDAQRMVGDQTMASHLRFAVCLWHTFGDTGSDPFGAATRRYPWEEGRDSRSNALAKLDAAFEFFTKLGVPFYCFHDRDLAPAGDTPQETQQLLDELVSEAGIRQKESGVRLLWGTANLFSHPQYAHGAMTSPQFEIVARAAAQVKSALEATHALQGQNFVFWGGREGYATLLNTNTQLERQNMGRFLQLARDHARQIGFKGPLLIEPKPMEPMKHQYDFDAETVIGFLREFDLMDDFKLNIEANHATLAGHTFAHELQIAADRQLLGSIDANRGDSQNGWDTDQFATNLYDVTEAMMVILGTNGLGRGGINFDAKLRRGSTDVEDLFMAHIGAMDTFARGLMVAHDILTESSIPNLKAARYASHASANARQFRAGQMSLTELAALAPQDNLSIASGQQERYENLFNQKLWK